MVQDGPHTDWAMMPTADVARKVVTKLAEYESRWRGFPPELMNNGCRTWKCLFNVVNYRLRQMRLPAGSQDVDEGGPASKMQLDEECSELEDPTMSMSNSHPDDSSRPVSMQEGPRHPRRVQFTDREPRPSNDDPWMMDPPSQQPDEELPSGDNQEKQLIKAFKEFVRCTRHRKRAEKELQKHASMCRAAWQRMQELGEPELLTEVLRLGYGKK